MEWTHDNNGEWFGKGEILAATITAETDDYFAITLLDEIPATRWEPADYREIEDKAFSSLNAAQAWALAKDLIAIGQNLASDAEIYRMA